jgi:hypothetical protein
MTFEGTTLIGPADKGIVAVNIAAQASVETLGKFIAFLLLDHAIPTPLWYYLS